MQTNDPRIAWCREHIPGFAEIHDQAEKARAETEANRAIFAEQLKEETS